jgi:hypothetical protein
VLRGTFEILGAGDKVLRGTFEILGFGNKVLMEHLRFWVLVTQC